MKKITTTLLFLLFVGLSSYGQKKVIQSIQGITKKDPATKTKAHPNGEYYNISPPELYKYLTTGDRSMFTVNTTEIIR